MMKTGGKWLIRYGEDFKNGENSCRIKDEIKKHILT